jgi:hypothetical protein
MEQIKELSKYYINEESLDFLRLKLIIALAKII